ncbi:MAG: ABC transporter substrate-binding protein [Bifidobacteriaceae bacterium]|jgi:peptide/nickel transport system substrate-binding protein|nr:ABC transporter substrate-binding protein [Bifidobacteriaceae bacterium]
MPPYDQPAGANAPKGEAAARRLTAHKTPTRLAAAAAAAMLAALTLAGCGGNAADEPKAADPTSLDASAPKDGGELIWAVEVKITTVNPHLNGQAKAAPILRNVFDSYLYLDGDGVYQPWLAKDYTVSEDGLTYTLELRDDVTFSDGAKLDADAVVANFDKFSDGVYLSSPPNGLTFLDSYTKTGDQTVEFKLSKPDIEFLIYLSTSTPLSPASLELPQDVLESGGPELAGVGPFTIESFTANTELVLAKRADYAWSPLPEQADHPTAYLDKVTYRTFAEGSTRTGALRQGQVDVVSDVQPLDVVVFEESPDFVYDRSFIGGTPYTYYLNVSKPPFDDENVRRAFILGADYQTLLDTIYQGTYDRAWTPVSAVGPFPDQSLIGWAEPDYDEANRLLDESGWTERDADGYRVKDGQVLTARVVTEAAFVRESRDQLAIAIGAALKQNVGIKYDYEIVDSGTGAERVEANDYEVFDNSYSGSDPVEGIDLLYYSSDPSRGFIARGKFNDPELEALIDEGRFTDDLATRKTAYTAFQNLVTKDKAYVLPLYQPQDNWAHQTSVHGITVDTAIGQPRGATTVWIDQ